MSDTAGTAPLLEVRGLDVEFTLKERDEHGKRRTVRAVNGLTFELRPGEVLGIVGESGSGKSVTNLALLQLTARNGTVSGEASFEGRNLLALTEAEIRKLRGHQISMIFQDPMTSLNPYLRVSEQIEEALQLHTKLGATERRERIISLLTQVGIPNAKSRYRDYPHEFSGGMRQRAMIAMALACEPKVLIADEPTTALDVTIQAQILELMRRLNQERQMSIIMITHNLGVVAQLCDRVIVMYAGRVMESGSVDEIFYRPRHPYTRGLLRSIPRLGAPSHQRLYSIPGEPPRPGHLPPGCPFAGRCDYVQDDCRQQLPELDGLPDHPGHRWACLHPVTDDLAGPDAEGTP